ncbi:MAG: tetratricopeptide repeat protein [Planctomycetales bacterium]|nr:tetratricopeptide repeat protein [Planctomycetales bacterium]
MSTAAPAVRRPWIVSPWWDLAYVVVTPVAIVPIVLMLIRHWLSPERVWLVVIAFASLGHHLPGFMRAYGDRELFARFRWRFLLAPPLVFAVALLFTPPPWLAAKLGLPWTHLHGLELVLLTWGTWHGLMQTYGFMRIYDLRQGENDRWTARLDHCLCLTIFGAGVVFSDTRMYGVANAMWQSGLPIFGPQALANMRWAVGAAGAVVGWLYVVNLLGRVRRGQPINWIKLLLAGMTGWFYWYCGRLSANLLIGIAMFEIYHAVQYDAIVWIYNRRLLARAGERFGPLAFLFQDRWTMLGIYLAMIAAYSSIRLYAGDSGDYIFRGGTAAYQWLFAMFATSAVLHFYYDGFIWKVSERNTQDNLVDEPGRIPTFDRFVPALVHAGKWGALLAVIGLLVGAEYRARDGDADRRDQEHLEALYRLTPTVPEAQLLASSLSLADGDVDRALKLARQAAQQRPGSHSAQANYAAALIATGDFAAARERLVAARRLKPTEWRYATDLGTALANLGETQQAEAQFRASVELAPTQLEPRLRLAEFLFQQGDTAESIAELDAAIELGPADAATQVVLGTALSVAGEYDRAEQALQKALELQPDNVNAYYQLGLLRLHQNEPSRAVAPLMKATQLAPNDFASHMQLGDALFALHKWRPAVDAYLEAAAIDGSNVDALVNLGSAYYQAGRLADAEEAYRMGLQLDPAAPLARYNLGMLLMATGRIDEGQTLLESLPPSADR